MADRPQKCVGLDTEPISHRLSMSGVREATWYAGFFGEVYSYSQPPVKVLQIEPAEENSALNRQTFVANAPTDIQALLTEVARQKAYIEELEVYIDSLES